MKRHVRAEWKGQADGSLRLELHYRGKSLASFPTTRHPIYAVEVGSQRNALSRAEEWARAHGFADLKMLG